MAVLLTLGWSLSSSSKYSVVPPVRLATPCRSLRQARGPRARPKHLQRQCSIRHIILFALKNRLFLYIIPTRRSSLKPWYHTAIYIRGTGCSSKVHSNQFSQCLCTLVKSRLGHMQRASRDGQNVVCLVTPTAEYKWGLNGINVHCPTACWTAEGCDSDCRGEHLTELLGRASEFLSITASSLQNQFFQSHSFPFFSSFVMSIYSCSQRNSSPLYSLFQCLAKSQL